jgi:ElaB/YqjD/DUF883 family membrane-anchored ribosome-binding protein
MNDQQLENKVRKDAGKVTEDLSTLLGNRVSQLSKGFEKLTGDAKESVVGAAATVKKDVGHGLSQYNDKAQDFADKVPDGFSKKAARYPWVAISIGLLVGFLLGILLKPD